jgi:hypothetical protein
MFYLSAQADPTGREVTMLNIWLTDAEFVSAVAVVDGPLACTLQAMRNTSQPNCYGQRLFKLTPRQWAAICEF